MLNSIYIILLGIAKKVAVVSFFLIVISVSVTTFVTKAAQSSILYPLIGISSAFCFFSIGVLVSKISLIRDKELENRIAIIENTLKSDDTNLEHFTEKELANVNGAKKGETLLIVKGAENQFLSKYQNWA